MSNLLTEIVERVRAHRCYHHPMFRHWLESKPGWEEIGAFLHHMQCTCSASRPGWSFELGLEQLGLETATLRRIVASGRPAESIDETAIADALYTAGLPDPDLVIRTGGEQRLSNFLIWQAAYAELYTTEVLWPDFGADAFDAALLEFASRTRRFGR